MKIINKDGNAFLKIVDEVKHSKSVLMKCEEGYVVAHNYVSINNNDEGYFVDVIKNKNVTLEQLASTLNQTEECCEEYYDYVDYIIDVALAKSWSLYQEILLMIENGYEWNEIIGNIRKQQKIVECDIPEKRLNCLKGMSLEKIQKFIDGKE